MNHKKEIECQFSALLKLAHGHKEIADKIICLKPIIAITFRTVINQFELERDRVPTVDELIWLTSELLDYDIRTLF